MLGEARAGERPTNSLVDCHLDFNTATKAPTIITKETTTAIEGLIKQRILDELFDDPILRENGGKKKKLNNDDNDMNFTKSKKGLGDIYADNMSKKLLEMNTDAFLETALSGPDAPLKREIEDISRDLFNQLETLCNFHYTPKVAQIESKIQTQNVASLTIEEALPISVSTG